ncbi:unnamed protein product, partial [Prorocentrum cordatum]
ALARQGSAMATLPPGAFAFVQYDDPADTGLWHERLIMGWISGAEYVVMTPDGGVFIEQLDSANRDLSGVRFSPVTGGLPAGFAGARLYRFAAQPAGADLAALLAEGASHARVERQARGLAQPPGAGAAGGPGGVAPVVAPAPLPAAPPPAAPGAPPPPPPAPRLAPASGCWVFDVPGATHSVGQEFMYPAGALDFGGRVFVTVGGGITTGPFVAADADLDARAAERQLFLMRGEPRLLPRRQPAEPAPFTSDALLLRKDARMEIRLKGGFMASHERCLVESRVPASSRSAHEHKVVSKALELAHAVDWVNLANLTCMEHLNRRRQLLEEARKSDPDKPNFEGTHYFLGEDNTGSGTLAAPSLRSHVAGEFAKDAAIEKPPGCRPPPGHVRPPGCLSDLSPLPLLDKQEADFAGAGRARSGQRRRCICRDVPSDVNDSLTGLNALYGCERSSVSAPTVAQRITRRRLPRAARTARQDFPDVFNMSPREVASELLGSRLDYQGSVTSVVPHCADALSLPPAGRQPVSLRGFLDSDAAHTPSHFQELLAEPEVRQARREGGPVRPYMDEVLKKDRSQYVRFWGQLASSSVLTTTSTRKASVTPFFVAKKTDKIRLAFDCREANQHLKHPPFTEIAAAESLSALGAPEGRQLYSACADIQCAFYQRGDIGDLRQYFCLPKVSRAEALRAGIPVKDPNYSSDFVYPATQ